MLNYLYCRLYYYYYYYYKILIADSDPNNSLPPDFHTYMIIVHLITLKSYCSSKKDLHPFAAKQAISLLRYTNDIPVDYAFYEAGKMAKVNISI